MRVFDTNALVFISYFSTVFFDISVAMQSSNSYTSVTSQAHCIFFWKVFVDRMYIHIEIKTRILIP